MKYTSRFRNKYNEIFEVVITTSTEGEDKELKLADESPVVITTSSDGLFCPIKSRSCTVTIVTKDILSDIYSGSSHGTRLEVNNLSKPECVFFGYVTPCEYNQPLLYLNEIEIEAVDALSTLQDFKYQYQETNTSNYTRIESDQSFANLIKYLITTAGYTGKIYIPKKGNRSYQSYLNNTYPMKQEYISDGVFVDINDDGTLEPMTCYEVLEEICNFYGISAVPCGDDVYFVDYALLTSGKSSNNVFINILDETETSVDLSDIISVDSYSGDDQNMELDEVYNKISIEAKTNEVKNEDLYIDPTDYVHKAAYIKKAAAKYITKYDHWKDKFFYMKHDESISQTYDIYDRYFYFTQKQINNKPTNKQWQCFTNTNVWHEGTFIPVPCLHDTFSNQYYNYIDIDNQPDMRMRLARYEYQWCTINQQFGFKEGTAPPIKIDWNTYIEFHTGVWPWLRYYNDINSGWTDKNGEHLTSLESKYQQYGTRDLPTLWWHMYTNELMKKPVLQYISPLNVNYTPATSGKTNYICFKGDLLWQRPGNFGESGKYNHHIWHGDLYDNDSIDYITFPLVDAGYSGEVILGARDNGTTDYNKGWSSLKLRLQIGNKYWNGSNWVNYACDFWIPYHKENVSGDQEKLLLYDWNSPVTNHSFESGINEECWAIPIKNTDYVSGVLTLQIYTPYMHTGFTMFNTSNGYLRLWRASIDGSTWTDGLTPVVLMKDLSISFVSANNNGEDGYVWIDKIENKDESDDIIYSNSLNSNNVLEFDDLELAINTYNSKQPISKSYVAQPIISGTTVTPNSMHFITNGFWDDVTGNTNRQEMNIISKYVNHYRDPKKIYNCTVHGYYKPYNVLTATAIPNTKFTVDEQSYDIKADINELKLIEY